MGWAQDAWSGILGGGGGGGSSAAAATAGNSQWMWPVFSAGSSALTTYMTNKAQADEARRTREFQQAMSSTSYQRAVADLKAAGLNPVLAAFPGGGASTPSGAMANFNDPGRNIAAGLSSAAAYKSASAQARNLGAQADANVIRAQLMQDGRDWYRRQEQPSKDAISAAVIGREAGLPETWMAGLGLATAKDEKKTEGKSAYERNVRPGSWLDKVLQFLKKGKVVPLSSGRGFEPRPYERSRDAINFTQRAKGLRYEEPK